MKTKKEVVILSGGFSEEAEVSRITAGEISKVLQKDKYNISILDPVDYRSYCDLIAIIKNIQPHIVLNGLHGAEGEDGRIQSLFSLLNLKLSGSDHKSSAISMDKEISGILAQSLDINVPKRSIYDLHSRIEPPKDIDPPFVIKPNDSGSSVGITLLKDLKEFNNALKLAFEYSNKVIVEEFIEGRELTVTILGNQALPVVEIKPKNGWYDYQNKYTKGNTIYEVPAEIDKEQTREIQKLAESVYNLFGCSVYARVDFRFDGENFYFLEVNTLPGMTPLSLTPMAAKEAGYNFEELIEEIINLSLV